MLRIPNDLAITFEITTWLRLSSYVSPVPNCTSHGYHMIVRVIQFPVAIDTMLLALILAILFRGDYQSFNVTMQEESPFSFTVTNRDVASLITSYGDFKLLSILLHFPDPACWPRQRLHRQWCPHL